MSLDFENICRLCMTQTSSMLSLFSENDCLPNKIMIILPVIKLFSGDGLPAQVCQQCVHQVNNFYDFKLQCENSEVALRQYLNSQDSEYQSSWSSSTMDQENKLEISEIVPQLSMSCDNDDFSDNLEVSIVKTENVTSASETEDPCSFSKETDKKKEPKIKKDNYQAMDLSNSKYSMNIEENMTFHASLPSNIYKQKGEMKASVRQNIDGRPHMCEQCGKRFKNRGNLKNHAVIHTGQKEHVCSVCGKRFKLLDHLKTHSLTHTGEKAHICDVCGKRFKLLGHLKTHALIHSGEKSHVCDTCGKSFRQLGGYKKHLMFHTGEKPFSCNLCGRSFREKNTLGIHIAIHTGQKPYSCDICGKRFANPPNLRSHIIVHTGEKKYCCKVCGKCFARSHTLKKHSATHSCQ